MSGEKEKTAVVTGSNSGIGFETSLRLAKNGFRTYATI
jgi:NAD(P)-dependent dehydrogenase (short-subunit alcohol dehydrogenase family)